MTRARPKGPASSGVGDGASVAALRGKPADEGRRVGPLHLWRSIRRDPPQSAGRPAGSDRITPAAGAPNLSDAILAAAVTLAAIVAWSLFFALVGP